LGLKIYFDKTAWFCDHLEKAEACNVCGLNELGQHKCLGLGNLNANVMFIGEAPGRVENPQLRGLPFVGNRSSDLMLELIYEYWPQGYNDVFISNVVKCNPPMNRKPRLDEINVCSKWLREELRIVEPKIVVALGRTAADWFGIREGLNSARLKRFMWDGIEVHVAWHPAYILRFNERMRLAYKNQFKYIRKRELELIGG